MSDPTTQELQEAIEELSAYRDRLEEHVIGIGKKLRLPQKKIDRNLAEHPELQRIKDILAQLVSQRDAEK